MAACAGTHESVTTTASAHSDARVANALLRARITHPNAPTRAWEVVAASSGTPLLRPSLCLGLPTTYHSPSSP